MNLQVRNLVIVFLAIGLASCQTGGGVKQAQYPAEVRGIGDSPNYPLVAAGFNRAEVMTYAPGMTDISTAYNIVTPEAQIASTIYRSSKNGRAQNLTDQYTAEKAQIEKYHPGSELIDEEIITLNKKGKMYSAKKASFRYNANFMRQQQVVYSELVLLSHEDKYIKLRSTTPIIQERIARKKNMELLNAVNWAN